MHSDNNEQAFVHKQHCCMCANETTGMLCVHIHAGNNFSMSRWHGMSITNYYMETIDLKINLVHTVMLKMRHLIANV